MEENNFSSYMKDEDGCLYNKNIEGYYRIVNDKSKYLNLLVKYDDTVFNEYIYLFHEKPFKINLNNLLFKNFIYYLIDNEWCIQSLNEKYQKVTHIDDTVVHKKNYFYTFKHKNLQCLICLSLDESFKKSISGLNIYYDLVDQKYVDDLCNYLIKEYYVIDNEQKTYINLIVQEQNQLSLKNFEIEPLNLNLENHYNHDFKEINDNIVKKLKVKNQKGLYLFHGPAGTGKTSYLKHLALTIKEKQFIFLPPSFSSILSEPGFLSFIINCPNSILIIEDGENIIKNRSIDQSSTAVSNILNISDGILGDILNIQIIITFNTNLKNVDQALLRAGRLTQEYEFKKLTVEKSQNLLTKLGHNVNIDKELTLAEIFNFNEKKNTTFSKNKIGF